LPVEHEVLFGTSQSVVDDLAAMPEALSGSSWTHHHEYASRAMDLAEHLQGAVELAGSGRYASSFSVLRTAFEQSFVDELLLLADRYRETIKTGEAGFLELEDELERGEAGWTSSVAELKFENNAARLVRIGHPVTSSDGSVVERLSPYAPVVEDHNALLGPPDLQEELAGAFADVEQLKKWASQNRYAYNRFLRWPAIIDNLKLNGRVSDREALEVETHYRFLSAFSHATGTGYRLVHGRQSVLGNCPQEHLLGELVLLYAASIAVTELRSFAAYVDERPERDMRSRTTVERDVITAAQTTSYFWYPRIGEPAPYDFFEEANRRAFPQGRGDRDELAPGPEDIPAAEVSYHSNPLERLERLHSGAREVTTGYSYAPLWG
jgi:hypothetical protein